MKNSFVVPSRLYKLINDAASNIKFDIHVRNDTVYLIDGEGHVHVLIYHGRIIDMPQADTGVPDLEEEENV